MGDIMKRKLIGVLVTLLMIAAFLPVVEADYSISRSVSMVYVDDDYTSSTPGWQIDCFDNIQDGIDAVDEHGTVYVYNGSFYENIVINKTIELIGENRDSTIIVNIFSYVLCEEVLISDADNDGIIVSFQNGDAAIDWYGAKDSNGQMPDPILTDFLYEDMDGNGVWNQMPPPYIDKTIRPKGFNPTPVLGGQTNYNAKLATNGSAYYIFDDNNDDGIYNDSEDVLFTYSATPSPGDLEVENAELARGSVDQYYFFKDSDHNNKYTIENYFGDVITILADNVNVSGFTIKDGAGIKITSDSNTIIGNNFINNSYGVWSSGYNNKIYNNNFMINTQSAYDEGINIWDNGYPSGGNYWDVYDESSEGAYDNNSDGIVDTPYDIFGGGNQDRYPFINQSGWKISIPSGIPTISGPTDAGPEIELNFTAVATDPEEDQLYYLWDWGDGNASQWLGPFDSGENVTTNHSWAADGEYEIKAKTKDSTGNESDWSEPHNISIAEQIEISNIKLGFVYLRTFFANNSYAYIYLLETLGLSVVISDEGLPVEAAVTDAVDSVTFELIDILWGDQINQEDDNSSDGFSTHFEIPSSLLQITVYAYDENGTMIDMDRLDYLVFIDLTSGEESQQIGHIGRMRYRIRERIRDRLLHH